MRAPIRTHFPPRPLPVVVDAIMWHELGGDPTLCVVHVLGALVACIIPFLPMVLL
jgi:hypothetical protein